MVGGRVRRRRIEPRPPTMCASVPSLRAADAVSLAQRETGPQGPRPNETQLFVSGMRWMS